MNSKGWTVFAHDIEEAWEIAEGGPMPLFLADILLLRARLFYREKPYPWTSPQTDIAAAGKLIESCGYLRRKQELEDVEKGLKTVTPSPADRRRILHFGSLCSKMHI
jgi:hypothetical protein